MRIPPAPCGENFMGSVWTLRREHLTPPVIPFPDKFGIFRERFRCRERFRAIFLPDAIRSAKRGNPACSRHAGAGHDGDSGTRLKARGELFDHSHYSKLLNGGSTHGIVRENMRSV